MDKAGKGSIKYNSLDEVISEIKTEVKTHTRQNTLGQKRYLCRRVLTADITRMRSMLLKPARMHTTRRGGGAKAVDRAGNPKAVH